ncbi:MAG TPA: hypothetical protein VNT03_06795 [Baekduia sp.]|nr:hypothetical protein [Baekduia sp.]
MTSTSTIVLQQASAEHDAALREISQLDSARTVARPALMAVVDGRLIAAASLHDGRVVADPFAETEEAVELLRLRSASLRTGGRQRRGARRRAPRLSLRPRAAV